MRITCLNHQKNNEIPELQTYFEEIKKINSKLITSANRLVIEPKISRAKFKYLLTLIKMYLHQSDTLGDYKLAAVQQHHCRFYSRLFRFKRISEFKQYPNLSLNMALLIAETQNGFKYYLENIANKYEFLSLTEEEKIDLNKAESYLLINT
jgi:predicted ester cyclase